MNEIVTDRTGELTIMGMNLPDAMPFEAWQKRLVRVVELKVCINWALADLLNHRQADTHEGAQAIADLQAKYGNQTDLSPQTLHNIKSIGARFPFERRTGLSWSHHEAVAYQPPDRADQLLRDAGKHSWTREELRAAVRKWKDEERTAGGNEPMKKDAEPRVLIKLSREFAECLEDWLRRKATNEDALVSWTVLRDAGEKWANATPEA